jgi:predicted NUDIX family NTP pyrophosphohydrolase
VEGDADPDQVRSNRFEMEWPRGSGRKQSFPEADRAEWFAPDEARRRIIAAQAAFLDVLARALSPW